jgi:hypothetical protein
MNKNTLAAAVAGALAATALSGGIAWATIPDDGGVIHGCYTKLGGVLRVIDTAKNQKCLANLEVPITWNEQGPKGDPGATGADGAPGRDGTNGSNGTNGLDGVSVMTAEEPAGSNCAQGGSRFTAANGVSYACNGARGPAGPSGGAGSLDALSGASCNDGGGALEITYASTGQVTLWCGTRYTLTVTTDSVSGGAGTVTSSPAGINCPGTCTASFRDGTNVTLTAAPSSSAAFSGWGGDCSGTTRTADCVLTMSDSKNATAGFAVGSTLTLNMSRVADCRLNPVTGGMSCSPNSVVTSSPPGLTCGPFIGPLPFIQDVQVCAATFPMGTTVTLNSSAPPVAWSAACVLATGNACTLTLDTASKQAGVSY